MRTLALLAASLTMTVGTAASAQNLVSTSQTYVCPKCGKLHVKTTPAATRTAVPATTLATASVTTPTVSSTVVTRPVPMPTPQPTSVQPVSYEAPVASTSQLRATGGITNVLAALNAQRARQGVPSLRYDPQLQAVAQRRVQTMASTGLKNHPPGSFAPGRYEGVGWSSSYSPSGVSACYTSDPRMQYAGAAMATGRDGVYFAVVYR